VFWLKGFDGASFERPDHRDGHQPAEHVRRARQAAEDLLRSTVRRATEHDLPSHADIDSLARFVMIVNDGLAVGGADAAQLHAAVDVAIQGLDQTARTRSRRQTRTRPVW
jgi:heterodisulfide reductase subunit A-like polyferredoxin